jgi:hypothetical protein
LRFSTQNTATAVEIENLTTTGQMYAIELEDVVVSP